jgi:hypothetical protein
VITPAGTVTPFVITVTLPIKSYTIFDVDNTLNLLLAGVIGTSAGFTISFDGVGKLTLIAYFNAPPITSITFVVDPASTFAIAKWLSTIPAISQQSTLIDFTINNDVLKQVVNHNDNSDAVIVDTIKDIQFRKYPPGYTINANETIDIQLRDDRDRIVDLAGADWIMTVYATIHA